MNSRSDHKAKNGSLSSCHVQLQKGAQHAVLEAAGALCSQVYRDLTGYIHSAELAQAKRLQFGVVRDTVLRVLPVLQARPGVPKEKKEHCSLDTAKRLSSRGSDHRMARR